MAIRQITVHALFQTVHVKDEQIGLKGMRPAAAWNRAEGDARSVGARNGLRAPQ